MEVKELLRPAALGLLFKGYLHNLRGPLQAALMQVELLAGRLQNLSLPEKARQVLAEDLERLKRQHYRLINLLVAAEEDLSSEEEGPWPLHEFLEREILFWEADLAFKHRVKKEIHLEEAHISLPRQRLRAGLCALFWAMVEELGQVEGELAVTLKSQEGRAELEMHWCPEDLAPRKTPLAAAREILSPEAEVSGGPGEIRVVFLHGVS
ncbi:hypothetical protein FVE67_00620 [Thermosulfurimonas marina]|uniref:HAMP domain-containing histidine kinase n=1 Tax=Thermosulfurimonas marina TaxID=2047767 RepID=A0A6H1WQA7_9BACT|nr:hypothetical protein [Thermosulfurimonas marina]QJA05382.1 hypothetical protein FVE67_00620 [Thermosulfurimonas marina]